MNYEPYRKASGKLALHGRHGNLDVHAQRVAEEAASQASAEMCRRLRKLFWKWEQKHGFRPGAGEILVPAGYNPERDRAAA